MSEPEFKICKVCTGEWHSRDQFINDPLIVVIGYQPNFVKPVQGLFLFNHNCGATLSISVAAFADLYDGPIYQQSKKGSEECSGFCLHRSEMRPCPASCECAYVREILALLYAGNNQGQAV
jgi:hypothetical protein